MYDIDVGCVLIKSRLFQACQWDIMIWNAGNPPDTCLWIPSTKASNLKFWCFICCQLEQVIEQTVDLSVIWDAMIPQVTLCSNLRKIRWSVYTNCANIDYFNYSMFVSGGKCMFQKCLVIKIDLVYLSISMFYQQAWYWNVVSYLKVDCYVCSCV